MPETNNGFCSSDEAPDTKRSEGSQPPPSPTVEDSNMRSESENANPVVSEDMSSAPVTVEVTPEQVVVEQRRLEAAGVVQVVILPGLATEKVEPVPPTVDDPSLQKKPFIPSKPQVDHRKVPSKRPPLKVQKSPQSPSSKSSSDILCDPFVSPKDLLSPPTGKPPEVGKHNPFAPNSRDVRLDRALYLLRVNKFRIAFAAALLAVIGWAVTYPIRKQEAFEESLGEFEESLEPVIREALALELQELRSEEEEIERQNAERKIKREQLAQSKAKKKDFNDPFLSQRSLAEIFEKQDIHFIETDQERGFMPSVHFWGSEVDFKPLSNSYGSYDKKAFKFPGQKAFISYEKDSFQLILNTSKYSSLSLRKLGDPCTTETPPICYDTVEKTYFRYVLLRAELNTQGQIVSAGYRIVLYRDAAFSQLALTGVQYGDHQGFTPLHDRQVLTDLQAFHGKLGPLFQNYVPQPLPDEKPKDLNLDRPIPLNPSLPSKQLWIDQRQSDITHYYSCVKNEYGQCVDCSDRYKSDEDKRFCQQRAREIAEKEWQTQGNIMTLPDGSIIHCTESQEARQMCQDDLARRQQKRWRYQDE